MEEENKLLKYWPIFSIALLIAFINLSSTVFLLVFNPNFHIHIVICIFGIFSTPIAIFLELSGIRSILWSKWKLLPIRIHKIICGICAFWIVLLLLTAFIPAMNKAYEKN